MNCSQNPKLKVFKTFRTSFFYRSSSNSRSRRTFSLVDIWYPTGFSVSPPGQMIFLWGFITTWNTHTETHTGCNVVPGRSHCDKLTKWQHQYCISTSIVKEAGDWEDLLCWLKMLHDKPNHRWCFNLDILCRHTSCKDVTYDECVHLDMSIPVRIGFFKCCCACKHHVPFLRNQNMLAGALRNKPGYCCMYTKPGWAS